MWANQIVNCCQFHQSFVTRHNEKDPGGEVINRHMIVHEVRLGILLNSNDDTNALYLRIC